MCVVLVFLLLPNITHSASRSSSSMSQIAYTFSISNLVVNNVVNGTTNPDQIYLARYGSGNVKSKKKPKDDD